MIISNIYARLKNIHLLYYLSVVATATFCYYLYVHNSFLYCLSDAYYYSSVAEGLYYKGTFVATTLDPAYPVVTTQNGIVYFHYLFLNLGVVSPYARMWLLAFSCIVTMFCSLFLVKDILLRVYQEEVKISALIISLISLNVVWYTSLLQPINDVYFTLLSFMAIGIYFSKVKRRYLYLLLVAFLINHFRMQGVFLFFALVLAELVAKRYKEAIKNGGLLTLSIMSPFLINPLLIKDFSGIEATNKYVFQVLTTERVLENISTMFKSTLPNLFVGTDEFGRLLRPFCVVLILYLIILGLNAFRKRDRLWLFTALFILSNIAFVAVFPSQSARYIISTLPFLFVVIVKPIQNIKLKTSFLYVYLIFLLLFIPYRLYKRHDEETFVRKGTINFEVNYSINKINSKNLRKEIGVDYDLIADTFKGRVAYFLFNKSCVDYATTRKEDVFFAGPKNSFLKYKKWLASKKITISLEEKLQYNFILRHELKADSAVYKLKLKYP